LPLRAEPTRESAIVGKVERGTFVTALDVVESEETTAAGGLLSKSKFWLKVSAVSVEGETIEGWAERGAIFVKDASRSNTGKVVADAVTVYSAPDAASAPVGELPQGTDLAIVDWEELEAEVVAGGLLTKPAQWIKITAETAGGASLEGWVKRGPVFVEDASISTVGRVDSGEGAKEWTLDYIKRMLRWTLDYIKRMLRDRNFKKAVQTTLVLLIVILPIQFTLAIIMALVLQSRLKFNTLFLYIYSIPLGISDLAAGLVWYSIFTQKGFLNTLLQQLGVYRPFPSNCSNRASCLEPICGNGCATSSCPCSSRACRLP